jgi:membrane-associated phospholipid phosphatase
MKRLRFRIIRRLPLILVLSTGLAWAAQESAVPADDGCRQIAGQLPHTASTFGHGLAAAPRNAIRLSNLKWELPIAAATGLLIATGDTQINNHIQSPSFEQNSARISNIGLGIELGAAGLMYLGGCTGHRSWSSYAAKTGFTALEAMGAADLMTIGIKSATNRQYAYHSNSQGEFWEGGRSFPSGHTAASFAFASVIAHRYPHNFWIKWGAYGLATGVSFARVGGKKHFASDILVGGALGYVTGTYLSTH